MEQNRTRNYSDVLHRRYRRVRLRSIRDDKHWTHSHRNCLPPVLNQAAGRSAAKHRGPAQPQRTKERHDDCFDCGGQAQGHQAPRLPRRRDYREGSTGQCKGRPGACRRTGSGLSAYHSRATGGRRNVAGGHCSGFERAQHSNRNRPGHLARRSGEPGAGED